MSCLCLLLRLSSFDILAVWIESSIAWPSALCFNDAFSVCFIHLCFYYFLESFPSHFRTTEMRRLNVYNAIVKQFDYRFLYQNRPLGQEDVCVCGPVKERGHATNALDVNAERFEL